MALFTQKKEKNEFEKTVAVKGDVNAGSPSLPKGEDALSYQLILEPHITEKATGLAALNKYVFKISRDANKTEIKKAIHRLYKVDVKNVRVLTMPSKTRRMGRQIGTKSGFRKAIVTLKEGNRIEVTA